MRNCCSYWNPCRIILLEFHTELILWSMQKLTRRWCYQHAMPTSPSLTERMRDITLVPGIMGGDYILIPGTSSFYKMIASLNVLIG